MVRPLIQNCWDNWVLMSLFVFTLLLAKPGALKKNEAEIIMIDPLLFVRLWDQGIIIKT